MRGDQKEVVLQAESAEVGHQPGHAADNTVDTRRAAVIRYQKDGHRILQDVVARAALPPYMNFSCQGSNVLGKRLYFLHMSAVLAVAVSDSITILSLSSTVHRFLVMM